MKKQNKKKLNIDKSDLGFEEDCEVIGFDDPGTMVGKSVSSFGFDDVV